MFYGNNRALPPHPQQRAAVDGCSRTATRSCTTSQSFGPRTTDLDEARVGRRRFLRVLRRAVFLIIRQRPRERVPFLEAALDPCGPVSSSTRCGGSSSKPSSESTPNMTRRRRATP